MKALVHSTAVRQQQGFEVYVLNNGDVELAVVPQLGAKIISLKNLKTGREWMWHPAEGKKLFTNRVGDDFARSPLVGADECFPTIAPCVWRGRQLPDHGEVWSQPWSVNADAWEDGRLSTSIRLKISPFELERTIELRDRQILMDYRLTNWGTETEAFLWAFHPLLRLQPDDQVLMPDSTRALLKGANWIDTVPVGIPEEKCAKIFAKPVTEGVAGVYSQNSGDRLSFTWDPRENDTLGIWHTRGGWHGHDHFALEPTNADEDSLAQAAETGRCGTVSAGDTVCWQIRLQI